MTEAGHDMVQYGRATQQKIMLGPVDVTPFYRFGSEVSQILVNETIRVNAESVVVFDAQKSSRTSQHFPVYARMMVVSAVGYPLLGKTVDEAQRVGASRWFSLWPRHFVDPKVRTAMFTAMRERPLDDGDLINALSLLRWVIRILVRTDDIADVNQREMIRALDVWYRLPLEKVTAQVRAL